MAQCHVAADERKHPRAMDMYVGALHSKLYSPNRDGDNYTYCPRYKHAASKSYDHASDFTSESFRKVHTSHSRSSLLGGVEQESVMSMASPTPDPSHGENYMRTGTSSMCPDNVSAMNTKGGELRSRPVDLSHGSHDNAGLASKGSDNDMVKDILLTSKITPKARNVNVPLQSQNGGMIALAKQPSSDAAVVPSVIPASKEKHEKTSGYLGDKKDRNGLEKCHSFNERITERGRNHKSAELGVESTTKGKLTGGHHSGARLFKSGEQFTSKGRINTLNMGGLKVDGSNSPMANKDGTRWPSFGSQGSVDSVGSPTAKDGGRKSSYSNGGSSDGGSPMAKDLWKRSSSGGYGSADSSGSSVGSPTGKDGLGRPLASNVLNHKEFPPPASLRGMGNIFGSGNIHGKVNGNESFRLGDGVGRKLENTLPLKCNSNVGDHGRLRGCSEASISSNLGNICSGNNRKSGGNPPPHGAATGSNGKPEEEGNAYHHSLDDPEEIKKDGNEQYKKGHFLEATALYDKCIALSPGNAAYRSNKAAALIGLGKLVEAVQECEDAVKLDPRYTRAHQRAAHIYLRLGLLESAKRHFKLAGQPEDARCVDSLQAIEKHISRCIEARKASDWKGVLRECTAASSAGADSAPQLLSYKSEALLKLHRLEEADGVCTEAQRLESSLTKSGLAQADSFLHMLRANIDMALGRFDGAIAAAYSAARIDPRKPEAMGLLRKARAVAQTRTAGNELFNAGKFFEACAAYGEGLESDPTNAVLLCNRAACRSKLGQWEKAIEDCDAALIAHPKYIKALMRRANCSTKLERWEDALRDYEVLRREMPDDMEVARGLFDVQVALKKARGEEVYKMKFGGEVEEIHDTGHLKDMITSPGLSVVNYYSNRTDRCCQISAFFEQLSKQYPCVHFVKVDVDEKPQIANMDSISIVPTFKIFYNGQKVREMLGPSQQELELAIKQYS